MKLTKQACDVINEMIREKANAKIDEINAKVKAIDDRYAEGFDARVVAFYDEAKKAIDGFTAKFAALLAKHGLVQDTKELSLRRFFAYNGDFCKSEVYGNTKSVYSKADNAEIERLHAERDAVNEKLRQAEREVVLRASLSGDYDEVMKMVDGLKF